MSRAGASPASGCQIWLHGRNANWLQQSADWLQLSHTRRAKNPAASHPEVMRSYLLILHDSCGLKNNNKKTKNRPRSRLFYIRVVNKHHTQTMLSSIQNTFLDAAEFVPSTVLSVLLTSDLGLLRASSLAGRWSQTWKWKTEEKSHVSRSHMRFLKFLKATVRQSARSPRKFSGITWRKQITMIICLHLLEFIIIFF